MAENRGRDERKIGKLVARARKLVDGVGDPEAEFDRAVAMYRSLSPEARPELFRRLLEALELPRRRVLLLLDDAGKTLAADQPVPAVLGGLRRELRAPLTTFFERIADTPGGLRLLVGLRADVLAVQRTGAGGIEPLEEAIADLLNEWFRHGLLTLREITEDSPYRLIRYLKERELVHPMVSLEEMGQRLGRDRRCFGLFHCAMPDAPVVFIEVALTEGIPKSIHEIIEGESDEGGGEPDTAVFYSINNTQNGLAGLGLGRVLVFRVTEALRRDHPGLRTFITLSPIPGFKRRYLDPILEGAATGFHLDRAGVDEVFSGKRRERLLAAARRLEGRDPEDAAEALRWILDRPDWIEDESVVRILARPMVEIAYVHITRERDPSGRYLNPVANFHLGNGATVSRRTIHFAANRSPRGLEESYGLMVSYVYSRRWFQGLKRSLGL